MTDNTSTAIYNARINLIVQSKYPEVLGEFKKTFFPTTDKFENLMLHVLDGAEYGAGAINKILFQVQPFCDYFGVFNDDVWFVDGWLEDTLRLLQTHEVASAGYVETADQDKFAKAVEATKDEVGVCNHLYGANAIFRKTLFKEIGCFDEQFDWSCDDLDWAWRIKLNGFSSVTSKKITMAHTVGETRTRDMKAWNTLSTANKQKFYNKHGYYAYRHIRDEYLTHHQYFRQFK